MSTLDRIPGAALLVDGNHTITDGNDRCQVVFREDVDNIRGERLQKLRTRGLVDRRNLERWESAIAAVRTGEQDEASEQVSLTPAGTDEEFSYSLRVTPPDGDRSDAVCCSLSSVGTDQRYDDTVTALHAATRDLMRADDREEVLERTAAAANEVLGFPGTAVRVHDPDENVLRQISLGARVDIDDTRPPYPVDDSPHGKAFRRNETVIDDIGEDDPYDRDVFSQTMYIPIGQTGLLSVGTIGGTFDETDVQFAEILAENAAAAVRVVETTTSLRQERERLDLLKQILTRVLRHNIRNDMNVIRGNVRRLATDHDVDDHPVDRVLECTDNILDLSEKARDLEKIIDSPRTLDTLELEPAVRRAVDRVSIQFPEASIETDVESCRVSAHEALNVAIENLLENACEHATEPTVSVTSTVEPERVRLDVADDGPGIPADEIEVLESDSETDLWHGSGLGLWIVKLVVEFSHGTIDFETGSDGTRVSVFLGRPDASAE